MFTSVCSHRDIPSHLTTPPRDLVQITSDPIIQDDIIKFVSDPTAGAITLFIGGCSLRRIMNNYKCIFIGTTRNHFEGVSIIVIQDLCLFIIMHVFMYGYIDHHTYFIMYGT